MNHYIVIALAVVMLSACSAKEDAPVPQIPQLAVVDPMASTREEELRGKRFEPMSNDDIIAETQKCNAANLDVESFDMPQRYSKGTIVAIQCIPRRQCQQ